MKCQKCNKNTATIHLTEIENGKKQEVHLCQNCYKEKSIKVGSIPSVDNLISSLLKNIEIDFVDEGIKCPVCGSSYAEFQQTGLFGCPEDYKVFKDNIEPLLEKIHGASKHEGKVPRAVQHSKSNGEKLITLRKELETVIKRELYEKAAQLRDRIRKIEKQE